MRTLVPFENSQLYGPFVFSIILFCWGSDYICRIDRGRIYCLPANAAPANHNSDIAGAVAAITEGNPGVESEKASDNTLG